MLYSFTRTYAMGCTMFLGADTKYLTLPATIVDFVKLSEYVIIFKIAFYKN